MRTETYIAGTLLALLLVGCGGGGSGGPGIAGGVPASAGAQAGSSKPGDAAALQALADGTLPAMGVLPVGGARNQARPIPPSGVRQGDARNGSYRVFGADGAQSTLSLNFDTLSYEMTDGRGASTSGGFAPDITETGTYVFRNTRISSGVNNARFRVTADALVGAFPFPKAYVSPPVYEVQPFLAARAFVTTAAQLDGTYNRLGISHSNAASSDSQILQLRISGGGKVLEMCFDSEVVTIDACPAPSKRTYAVSSGGGDLWRGTNPANTDDQQTFRIARIGGENVYLTAGQSFSPGNQQALRIGLLDSSAWPARRFIGASTEKTWGTQQLDATTSLRRAVDPDGNFAPLTLPVTPIGGPLGIRGINLDGNRRYFAMQKGLLSVIVGTRNPNTRGYIQINLLDEGAAANEHNGRYKVFAANGAQLWLALNMDTQRYEMTDQIGATSAGPITADPAEPGTYFFHNTWLAKWPLNTARFRLTSDTVVGGFGGLYLLSLPNDDPYSLQPFVATRAFVTQASELAGTYTRFSHFHRPDNATRVSIETLRIDSSGSQMRLCADASIHAVDNCPADKLQIYAIAPGPTAGRWDATSLTNPDARGKETIHMARIGGQNVILQSSIEGAPSPAAIMRVALPESDTWPSVTVRGSSTYGTWTTATIDSTAFSRVELSAWNAVGRYNDPLKPLSSPTGPRGLWVTATPGSPEPTQRVLMQGSALSMAIVQPDPPVFLPVMHIYLID